MLTSRAAVCIARVVVLAAIPGLLAQSVSAQDVPLTRPYRGLFGGGDPTPSKLELLWSVLGMRDEGGTANVGSNNSTPGFYEGTSARLAFSAGGPHATFGATASGNGRYYPQPGTFSLLDSSGDVNFAADLGRKTRITAAQGAGYQPFYQLDFLTNVTPSLSSSAQTPDDGLTNRVSHQYNGRVQLEKTWGTRSKASLEYSYRRTYSSDSPEPFRWDTLNGVFTQKLTQYAALRLGYGEGEERDGLGSSASAVKNKNIDAGVDYSRPLSSSRKTRLDFRSGTSVVTDKGTNYYRLLIDATVVREIGRTWNATMTYHRGIQYVEGFAGPLYADTVQLHVNGLVTKRVDVSVSSGYSNGDIGLSTAKTAYNTYSASADVRIALTRLFSFQTQFLYYYYDFRETGLLPEGFPRSLDRLGVRFGVTGWLPLRRR